MFGGDYKLSRYTRRTSTISPRFFMVFAGLVLLIVILSLVLIFMSNSAITQKGTISFSHDTSGIVIREETCYQSQNYGKANFLVDEGQEVIAGTAVADVYTWDYSDSAEENLLMLQNSILDYQQNNILKDVENKGLDSLNLKIEEKSAQINSVVSGEASGDLLQLEKELQDLLDQRTQFLRENVSTDPSLEDLYSRESDMIARIEDWEETVAAEAPGIVSYYFDGNEQLLTQENMKELTVANIEEIMSGRYSSEVFNSDDAAKPLYRLVDANKWYITIIEDSIVPEFENTNTFTAVFNDSSEDIYSATVIPFDETVPYKKDGSKYIYYLEFTGDVSSLLMARNVNFTLSADYVGLQIPANAVTHDEIGDFVEVKNGEKIEKIYIKVLIERNGYVIVEPINVTDGLNQGSEVVF